MSTSIVKLGLMASATLAQDITTNLLADRECTADTAKEACTKLAEENSLIKPMCLGEWQCQLGRCSWKCTFVDDVEKCPDGTLAADAYKLCAAKGDTFVFQRADCTCVEKEKRTCPDGSNFREKAEACFQQGGAFNPDTCECKPKDIPQECPALVAEGCRKVNGIFSGPPDCECKHNPYCPAPMETVLKSAMMEKCAGAGLKLDYNTCECIVPDANVVDPVPTEEATCTYAIGGEQVTVPITKARMECASRGNHQFHEKSGQCFCVRQAIDTASMCPDADGNPTDVTVEFAKRACGAKGFFAYPRTFDFNPDTCACTPVPADLQEPVDCSAFRSCDKANPCLGPSADSLTAVGDFRACQPFDPDTKRCPEGTKPCGRFGDGGADGSVCPDGTDYAEAKKKCLAHQPSIWHPLRCKCELIVPPTCKDGTSYEEAKRKCLANDAKFVPETCECIKPEDVKCADSTADYDALKARCVGDDKFFVDAPHCKCITKLERPSTEGCNTFSSIAEAYRLCPGAQADPPTQDFDKSDCTCRDLKVDVQEAPRMPYKQDVRMVICRDGITVENVKEAIAKIMAALKARILLKYPEATIVFHGATKIVKPDGSICVGVKFSIIHNVRDKLDALVKEAVEQFTANRDVEDAIKNSLLQDTAPDAESKPVSLAFEAEGAVSGGDAAVTNPPSSGPSDNTITGSATAAAPAVLSLLASALALF